ncbi:hypothetical protein QP028_15120 [Corynebacterium suedekumii]|nr:hypothetical protein QP028_15120 [Corynebacterium suedekumii]
MSSNTDITPVTIQRVADAMSGFDVQLDVHEGNDVASANLNGLPVTLRGPRLRRPRARGHRHRADPRRRRPDALPGQQPGQLRELRRPRIRHGPRREPHRPHRTRVQHRRGPDRRPAVGDAARRC